MARVARDHPHSMHVVPPPSDPLELEACYRYCEALVRSRRHNFPVASFFAPSRLRRHMWAIYAFARMADDFADEPVYAGRRAVELDAWEDRLDSVYYGAAQDNPIFAALAHTIDEFHLPITPFKSLLSGFRSDIENKAYTTYQGLRGYTALAAEPMGALFLYLAGYRDARLVHCAEELAAAVAFANFWQDVAADLERDRIYIPQEDLRYFGVTETALREQVTGPKMRQLIGYEVARTRAMLAKARPLVDDIGDDMAVELALVWHGVARILDKIEAVGAQILVQRPSLTSADKARVVAAAMRWRGGSLAKRAEDRFRGLLQRS